MVLGDILMNNLIDAILILQAAFKQVPPDSGKQWDARAHLLGAIQYLAKQDRRIKVA